MQTILSRDWTRVVDSISSDGNRHAEQVSIKCIYLMFVSSFQLRASVLLHTPNIFASARNLDVYCLL